MIQLGVPIPNCRIKMFIFLTPGRSIYGPDFCINHRFDPDLGCKEIVSHIVRKVKFSCIKSDVFSVVI